MLDEQAMYGLIQGLIWNDLRAGCHGLAWSYVCSGCTG